MQGGEEKDGGEETRQRELGVEGEEGAEIERERVTFRGIMSL